MLFPAFGFPIRPTSAIDLSSRMIRRDSPYSPGVHFRGADPLGDDPRIESDTIGTLIHVKPHRAGPTVVVQDWPRFDCEVRTTARPDDLVDFWVLETVSLQLHVSLSQARAVEVVLDLHDKAMGSGT